MKSNSPLDNIFVQKLFTLFFELNRLFRTQEAPEYVHIKKNAIKCWGLQKRSMLKTNHKCCIIRLPTSFSLYWKIN